MYNPFSLFSTKLLEALRQSGHGWFVRQTYKRGVDSKDGLVKAAFLLTHYNNAGRAQQHFDALENDPNRFLYDCTNAEHLQKLEIAAKQPPGYRIYSPLLEKTWRPTHLLAEKIRRYINGQLTWTPGRNDDVAADLFTQFGELYITLKYRNNKIKVPLGDIENY